MAKSRLARLVLRFTITTKSVSTGNERRSGGRQCRVASVARICEADSKTGRQFVPESSYSLPRRARGVESGLPTEKPTARAVHCARSPSPSIPAVRGTQRETFFKALALLNPESAAPIESCARMRRRESENGERRRRNAAQCAAGPLFSAVNGFWKENSQTRASSHCFQSAASAFALSDAMFAQTLASFRSQDSLQSLFIY